MSAFANVRRYASLEEARVAWSFLRSAEIDAELDHHEASSNLVWGATYGVDLRVPAKDAEDVLAAIHEVECGAFAIPEVEPVKRAWATRAKGVFLLLWIVDLPLLAMCALIMLLSLGDPTKGRSPPATAGPG